MPHESVSAYFQWGPLSVYHLKNLTKGCPRHTFRKVQKRSIHLPKNTAEYPNITQEYPQKTCEYPWKTEKQIEFFYFPKTMKNYQNLIKMITMKINGTISRHNSWYMFKKRKLRTKTTNNYCMAWYREARCISLFRSIWNNEYLLYLKFL